MQPSDPPDPSRVGQPGPTPFGPLPPSAPPPVAAPTTPPPVSPSKSVTRVAVTRHILWVGAAAYPLAMIARVGTTVLVPEKAGAVLRLLRVIGVMTVFALVIELLSGLSDSNRSSSSGGFDAAPFIVVAVVIVVVYFFAVTLPRLVQPRLYALSVDTAGTPSALLAWESPGPAQELQATITRAIENPQIEFQQFVTTVTIDRRHYQSGDSVNIYGGHGITGVSK